MVLNLNELNKIRDAVPPPSQPHFKGSTALCGQWLQQSGWTCLLSKWLHTKSFIFLIIRGQNGSRWTKAWGISCCCWECWRAFWFSQAYHCNVLFQGWVRVCWVQPGEGWALQEKSPGSRFPKHLLWAKHHTKYRIATVPIWSPIILWVTHH